jgi:NAD+ synthase|tara:strand:+ start:1831 stop:3480 length:1650 start_codon:yes stop_codon:yes gene_type:complete
MKLFLAQLNNIVGDIEGNLNKAIDVLQDAKKLDSDLVIFSELFLSGYPPEDLVLKKSFVSACKNALDSLITYSEEKELGVIIGLPIYEKNKLFNAAAVIDKGQLIGFSKKVNLPNYSVFDEKRVFNKNNTPEIFNFRGIKLGIPICEDIWMDNVCKELKDQGCELIISPNGSPFDKYKINQRKTIIEDRVTEVKTPFVYVNQFGGQDELVFDGSSLVMNGNKEVVFEAPSWEENTSVVEFNVSAKKFNDLPFEKAQVSDLENIYMAMVIGLKDYVAKNNFPGVILGLSGGIDSAFCAAVAVDALGKDKVNAYMLPSVYTSKNSLDDAKDCAKRLEIHLDSIPIGNTFLSLEDSLEELFKGLPTDITEENLQSRIRGTILMAISNKIGKMLITTGNKSEVSVGYSTLYGDMNGGFNPIKDIYKTELYALANWRNLNVPKNVLLTKKNIIPETIISKEPTAELRDNQKDSDSLPSYDQLDQILEGLVEYELSTNELEKKGFSRDEIKKVENLLYVSEYKRRQSAPGVKISLRNFGRDRRYPITNKYRDKSE